MKNYQCAICNEQIENKPEEKMVGTDFVTYGYVCKKCQHEHGKVRLAELLNLPGVTKLQ